MLVRLSTRCPAKYAGSSRGDRGCWAKAQRYSSRLMRKNGGSYVVDAALNRLMYFLIED